MSSPLSHLENREAIAPAGPPLWKSKSLRLATAMMLIGLVMWPRPPADSETAAANPVASSTPAKSNSTLAPKSPAMFRFGASYLGGFFIGWLCRKSLKIALLAGGAVAVAIAAAKHSGLVNLNWAGIEANVTHSLNWVEHGVGAAKAFLTGYLPSTAAGFLGLYKGARRG